MPIADSLGWALYRLGRFAEAQEELERAIDLSPDNATILEHLGDVYRALGERELAVDAYEKAVALEEQGIDQAEGDVQRQARGVARRAHEPVGNRPIAKPGWALWVLRADAVRRSRAAAVRRGPSFRTQVGSPCDEVDGERLPGRWTVASASRHEGLEFAGAASNPRTSSTQRLVTPQLQRP